MDELRKLEFQCRSGDWYSFTIHPLNTTFPNSTGIYIFVAKDKSDNFGLQNYKFLHVGVDNDLSHLNDMSDYYPKATNVLISLREAGVDMVHEWKDIQNSFSFN